MSVGAVNKNTGERIQTAGMPAIDSVLSGSSTNPVQNRVVKAALDEKADTDIIASDFSAAASYTAGDYCIYEGKFYKFKNDHSGAWAAADVNEIKIAGELSSLMSGLTSLDFGKMIYDGTGVNINEIITPGWHYGSSTGAGLDTVDDYYMLVFHLGNSIKQFIIGKFGYGKKLYMRYSGDGGTSWSVSKIEFTDVT